MSESNSHKRAKSKAAGNSGKKEVPISGNRRLDASTSKKAIEIERGGTQQSLVTAAHRLKSSGKLQKVLQVPQKDMVTAAAAMKKVGVSGTV